MMQFTLRTLLLSALVIAGVLSLLVLGGGSVVASTLIIGVVIGGCGSFLFRKSNVGAVPILFSVAAAIVSEILGIYMIDFHVEDWDNEFGKLPWGLDLLFWYAFYGALAGVALGLAVCMWRRWCEAVGLLRE